MIKEFLRKILIRLHLDLTKNLEYDRLTTAILKRELHPDSNTIDIGCHKGEIMDDILRFAPQGSHFGFEPIPEMAEQLRKKYAGKNVIIHQVALSDQNGTAVFNHVVNKPAYSGLKKRNYDFGDAVIDQIEVKTELLDSIIDESLKIDLIKIDVEGAEFAVLKGALNTIKKSKPVIIFECGLGASDFYGTQPEDLYVFLSKEAAMKIYTLKDYYKNKKQLSESDFKKVYSENSEYSFVARY
jgi:FkbM family methyltransferase